MPDKYGAKRDLVTLNNSLKKTLIKLCKQSLSYPDPVLIKHPDYHSCDFLCLIFSATPT